MRNFSTSQLLLSFHATMNPLCISVTAASKLLGISKRSLYSYIEAGLFPAIRIGRRILIRKADLEALITAQQQK
jgi:excisionase family DNA binding protein